MVGGKLNPLLISCPAADITSVLSLVRKGVELEEEEEGGRGGG